MDSSAAQEARQALRTAQAELRRANARTSEIMAISRTLRRLGERNHFAPLIRDALRGRDE